MGLGVGGSSDILNGVMSLSSPFGGPGSAIANAGFEDDGLWGGYFIGARPVLRRIGGKYIYRWSGKRWKCRVATRHASHVLMQGISAKSAAGCKGQIRKVGKKSDVECTYGATGRDICSEEETGVKNIFIYT